MAISFWPLAIGKKNLTIDLDHWQKKTLTMSRPEIGLHKKVNLWNLEYMKTKRA